jgi:xyloglucan fucosyltransferase
MIYVYIHLVSDYHDLDKLFFCDDDQRILRKVNWLLLKSIFYFVPSIYTTALFEEELDRLFPSKESTFYLLAHYLFHPSNSVWKLVMEYYTSYLADADEKIGVQVRVLHFTKVSSDVIFQQILNCSKLKSVLPGFDLNETIISKTNEQKSESILVVSLYAEYYEKLKSLYNEHSLKTGQFVNVHQPTSHEETQNTEDRLHNRKALAEIYLLRFCDVLMTSGFSTFGYVSSGLAGIRPIILMPIWGQNVPDLPCVNAISMEPCHLLAPKSICGGKTITKEKLEQYVMQCPDDSSGIKLFD